MGQDSMLLWASLLVLALSSEQFDLDGVAGMSVFLFPKTKQGTGTNFCEIATAPKPVISLHPPWTTVFIGETLTLTCNGFHSYAPEKTKWFQGYTRKIWRQISGNTLQACKTGLYRCQTDNSPLSDPVLLTFSTGSLILQAPHSVFEGDTLVLRCRIRRRETLTVVQYYQNGKTIHFSNKSFDLSISRASSRNSGTYYCTGYGNEHHIFKSNIRVIKIQELFSPPKLKVTATQPTEGTSVNISCETHLPPARRDTPLRFIFFRDSSLNLSDWHESSALQIPAVRREDSGLYSCAARAAARDVSKRSRALRIQVQRIPVSHVSMETHPPGGQAIEGEMLILVCSVAKGTGDITFSWHISDKQESLGWKTQRSQRAELEIPVILESHTGTYYCMADNSYGPVQSDAMNITVRLTPGNRKGLIAGGTTGGLLSILLAVILLFYYCHLKKSGDGFQGEEIRSVPTPGPGASHHSICPVQVDLKVLHGNVNLKERELIYSDIQFTQLEEGEASTSRIPLEEKDPSTVYSELKTQLPDDSAGNVTPKVETP